MSTTTLTVRQAYAKGWSASKRTTTCDLDAATERFERRYGDDDDLGRAFSAGWVDYAADRPMYSGLDAEADARDRFQQRFGLRRREAQPVAPSSLVWTVGPDRGTNSRDHLAALPWPVRSGTYDSTVATHILRWYNRYERSWVVSLSTADAVQVGSSEYLGSEADSLAEAQHLLSRVLSGDLPRADEPGPYVFAEAPEVRCPQCGAEPGEPCYPDNPISDTDVKRVAHLARTVRAQAPDPSPDFTEADEARAEAEAEGTLLTPDEARVLVARWAERSLPAGLVVMQFGYGDVDDEWVGLQDPDDVDGDLPLCLASEGGDETPDPAEHLVDFREEAINSLVDAGYTFGEAEAIIEHDAGDHDEESDPGCPRCEDLYDEEPEEDIRTRAWRQHVEARHEHVPGVEPEEPRLPCVVCDLDDPAQPSPNCCPTCDALLAGRLSLR